MSDKEAYRLIGERAELLSRDPAVQEEALKIAEKEGKESGERFIYRLAIATLCGVIV